jgi:hypothetical protein
MLTTAALRHIVGGVPFISSELEANIWEDKLLKPVLKVGKQRFVSRLCEKGGLEIRYIFY